MTPIKTTVFPIRRRETLEVLEGIVSPFTDVKQRAVDRNGGISIVNRIVFIIMVVAGLSLLNCTQRSLPEKQAEEHLPNFSLITNEGKITTDHFLQDGRPEFLLFISPY